LKILLRTRVCIDKVFDSVEALFVTLIEVGCVPSPVPEFQYAMISLASLFNQIIILIATNHIPPPYSFGVTRPTILVPMTVLTSRMGSERLLGTFFARSNFQHSKMLVGVSSSQRCCRTEPGPCHDSNVRIDHSRSRT
jgi:hypothetical protein